MRSLTTFALVAVAALVLAGCSGPSDSSDTTTNGATPPASPPASPPAASSNNPYDAPSRTTSVYGSGATFPKPIIEAWGLQYAHEEPTVQVSYAGGGSGKGRTDITKKDVVFAGSDAPMSVAEKAAAPGILQFPETLGAIAVIYNVAGAADGLQIDGETIGKIYSGGIRKWNEVDPALPDANIAIVYRSDSSGTTFAFTDFLAKASPTWKGQMTSGGSGKPDWTKSTASPQLTGNGNDGVASTVKTTPNSIGYVEQAYVKSLALKAAKVKSHDGEYLAPSAAGATAAAASAGQLPDPSGDWSKVSIAYAPGAGAYPISTYTYMLVYDSLAAYGSKATADQYQAFKAWMWWCLHDGQEYSEALGYAKLPASTVALAEGALASMH